MNKIKKILEKNRMRKIYIVLLIVLTQVVNANNVIDKEKLCSNGDYSVCFTLGQKYAEGTNVKKDLIQAVKLYEKACIGGNDGGCFNLAIAYRHGQGVEKDYMKAVELYKKSCDLGAFDGCANLAFMYDQGLGVEKNISQSIFFSKKACDGGNVGACYNLSLQYIRTKDFIQAREVSIKACDKEHAGACYNLGLMYIKGDGTKKDNQEAYKYFSKACDRGAKEGCEYAKSNFRRHITGGKGTVSVENGLGYEYWNDIKKARDFISNKEFDKALKILNSVIQGFESKYIQKNRIFVSVKTKKEFDEYLKATKETEGLWLDFSYRDAYYYKAFISIERKQFTEATRILKKLTLIAPNDSHIYTELGGIYNQTGRAREGLVEYVDAYKIAKKYGQNMAVSLRGIGFSYIELHDLTKAKKAYEMSLQIEPNNKIALDELKYIESMEKKK